MVEINTTFEDDSNNIRNIVFKAVDAINLIPRDLLEIKTHGEINKRYIRDGEIAFGLTQGRQDISKCLSSKINVEIKIQNLAEFTCGIGSDIVLASGKTVELKCHFGYLLGRNDTASGNKCKSVKNAYYTCIIHYICDDTGKIIKLGVLLIDNSLCPLTKAENEKSLEGEEGSWRNLIALFSEREGMRCPIGKIDESHLFKKRRGRKPTKVAVIMEQIYVQTT